MTGTMRAARVHAFGRPLTIEEVPIPTRYTIESSSISVKRSLTYIGLTIVELFRARLKPRTPPRHS